MSRTDKYQAAGHATMAKRGAHVGATDLIREALKAGPLRRRELVECTGLPLQSVKSVLGTLSGHFGGVVAIGKGAAAKYALYDSPEARAALGIRDKVNVAQPCRHREFRELHRDPFALMNLAMTTRRT